MSEGPLLWYRLRWPREVAPAQVEAALRVLAGSAGAPLVLEAIGEAGVVTHRVAVLRERAGALLQQLRAALPGLSLELDEDRGAPPVGRSVELSTSTRLRPLQTEEPGRVSQALITALAHVGRGELLGLQWVLARPIVPLAVPHGLSLPKQESWLGALLVAPLAGPQPADAETLAALRAKQGQPGWRARGRIAVKAASRSRERQLIRQVLGALRTAEGPSVGFRVRSGSPKRFAAASPGWRRPLVLNVGELCALAAWPLGMTGELPVATMTARALPPSAAIRRTGRILARASFPGREHAVALSPLDSLRHLHLIGATGTGKSTAMLNLIVRDMQAGRAVVVVEPKGDLIADVLERVPAERLGDVVLIDPTDRERVVGLNPLARAGRSPSWSQTSSSGSFTPSTRRTGGRAPKTSSPPRCSLSRAAPGRRWPRCPCS